MTQKEVLSFLKTARDKVAQTALNFAVFAEDLPGNKRYDAIPFSNDIAWLEGFLQGGIDSLYDPED